jgi:protein-L-isoaspartate(D-aspartate) O-methyltransferase
MGSTIQALCRVPTWLALTALLTACGRRSAPGQSSARPLEPAASAAPTPARTRPSTSASTTAAAQPDDGSIAGDTEEARRERARLVRQIEIFDKPWGDPRWDPRVVDAMRRVPRHLFMPGASVWAAYRDAPHPIGYGQTISQPTVVALMSNALRLGGREKVLEIGTGSGYQAAVLSLLARTVYSIEIVAPLGTTARDRLARLGYRNVQVRIGDGYAGWPEHAPFDRIILTAAPPKMPDALVEQLVDGGIIVAPVGEVDQVLVRWTKRAGRLHREPLGAVRFVPMVPGKPEK